MRLSAVLPLLCSLTFVPALASAEEGKELLTHARAVFQQGIELEQAGNWSAAVQRFREVGQVRMTPQVRFHIALCEEKLGRLVAALGGYELALADADTVGPDFRAEVEENVNRLRERIPKLVIHRGSGAGAAIIELDGVAVGESSIGVDVRLDPGPHSVIARAPEYERFEQTVTLAEGERTTVDIVMTPLPPDVVAAGPSAPKPISKLRLTSYIVGGVGGATLVASGVLFALRQSTLSGLEDSCPNNVCPRAKESAYDRLKTYHYASIVTLGVGAAAVATAAALFVVDVNKQKQETQALRLFPLVSPAFAGAQAQMRF